MITTFTRPARYLRVGLWFCLYSVLITPLLIGDKFLFPFISLKTFYFRLLVEFAFFLYLCLAVFSPDYRPRFNKLTLSVLIFGALVGLTALTGANPYRSFWGTIERGEGFLTISHLLVWFFLLTQVFRSKRQWLNYFATSVSVSLLVGLYALAQASEHFSWVVSASGRLSSTLGNAAYLGAYALGHFWLCIILFLSYRSKIWRALFACLAIFELFILWRSETRGALLGLLIAALIFLILLALLHPRRKIKIIVASLLLLLVGGSLFVWFNRSATWVKKSNTLNRLTSISFHDITTQSRLYAWDSSWRGWRDRFLLGYGWENYNLAFNKYFHAEIFQDNGSQIWFDRAHNTVFDVAVATGLVGLIAYLSFFVLAFYYLFKFLRRDADNLSLYLLVAAFLLAHFIQNIFVFDCLATYLMLFMVLGFVSFAVNKHENRYAPLANARPLPALPAYSLLVLSFIFLLFAASRFNLRPAQANTLALRGLQQFYNGQITQGLNTLRQAIDAGTYQTPEIRQKLADNVLNFNRSDYLKDDRQLLANFQMAFGAIKDNLALAPSDVQNQLYLMILYNAASRLDVSLPAQVLRLGETALRLSPTRPQIYFEMGQAAINLGQFKEGLSYFQKGVDLNPKNLDSRWLLLTAELLTRQTAAAGATYQDMLKLGLPINQPNLERLAGLYALADDYPTLINLYQQLTALAPTNLSYWQSLAKLYQKTGDLSALEQVNARLKSLTP